MLGKRPPSIYLRKIFFLASLVFFLGRMSLSQLLTPDVTQTDSYTKKEKTLGSAELVASRDIASVDGQINQKQSYSQVAFSRKKIAYELSNQTPIHNFQNHKVSSVDRSDEGVLNIPCRLSDQISYRFKSKVSQIRLSGDCQEEASSSGNYQKNKDLLIEAVVVRLRSNGLEAMSFVKKSWFTTEYIALSSGVNEFFLEIRFGSGEVINKKVEVIF